MAHRVGMEHHRDQVGGWRFAGLRVPQRLEIGPHVVEMARPFGILDRILSHFDIARPVGPEGQQAAILPWEIKQYGEHLRGQFDRDPVDPVEALTPREFVENLGRALTDVGAHPRHFAWREGRPDGTALIGVLGPVHRDEVGHRFFIRAAIDDADPATIGPGRGIDLG